MPGRSTRATRSNARQDDGRDADETKLASKSKRKLGHSGDEQEDDEDSNTRKRKAVPTSNGRRAAATKRGPAKRNAREDADHDEGEDENADENEDAFSLDSDALDDDEPAPKKRKQSSSTKGKSRTKSTSPKKKKQKDVDEGDVIELHDGQEVVGVVVQAPKSGRVPPGQISKNTLDFLSQLRNPECNDRQWFKLHEPVYRLAEKEWKDFIEAFTDVLVEADPQVPHLPPKDVTHRIYRDVRFSNDKTPYKTGFSASFSRGGRKGIWAGSQVCIIADEFHLEFTGSYLVKSGGQSMIAAGVWQPQRNELATIRGNLLRSTARLRGIISDPQFVGLFGEPKPHPKGERQSIFGREDELKTAPQGVDKNHKDIDLLKCRSFAVVHMFTDKQVLQAEFKEELGRLVSIMRPFVHCLNDLMTIQNQDSSEDEDEDDEA